MRSAAVEDRRAFLREGSATLRRVLGGEADRLEARSYSRALSAGRLRAARRVIFAVSAAIVLFFVPVWGEFPITKETANQRLRFKGWKP